MRANRTASLVVCLVGIVLSAACGSSNVGPDLASGTMDDSGRSGTSGGASGNAGGLGNKAGSSPQCSDASAGDLAGCGCSQPSRACFTVAPTQRNQNGCTDGTQACATQGEFSSWGPCTGEVTACAPASPPSGGTADAGAPPAGCVCFPGAVRWCDSPEECAWGQQQCKPDGNWGPCVETNARPPGCAGGGPDYDEDCCLRAGQCCQDYDGDQENKSKGSCAQIACAGDIVP